jgi:hypothetical protein
MHRRPVLGPRVINNAGPRDPRRTKKRIVRKESHHPRTNVLGPRAPKANVVTQTLPLVNRENKSALIKSIESYLVGAGLFVPRE